VLILYLRDSGIINKDAGEEPDSDNEKGGISKKQGQWYVAGAAAKTIKKNLNLRLNN
jgi:hypothetical protein